MKFQYKFRIATKFTIQVHDVDVHYIQVQTKFVLRRGTKNSYSLSPMHLQSSGSLYHEYRS